MLLLLSDLLVFFCIVSLVFNRRSHCNSFHYCLKDGTIKKWKAAKG